jgi:acyl-coenzyme A thioesterase PaaI-like protein
MGAAPAVQTANEMLNPLTDEETVAFYQPEPNQPSAEINQRMLNHPLTLSLQSNPKFVGSRPHLKIPPTLRSHNFTSGTLLGDDKLPVPPLTFNTPNGDALVSIQYLGNALCGHPGIVHGGMLATLMDEGLARCCFPALPHKVGVTATLTVNYRKPCKADQFVVLKAETTKVEGRKAWVKGRLETLPPDGSDGDLLVEADALFVEPRQVAVSPKKFIETAVCVR